MTNKIPLLDNERGFVLAMAIILLAVCTIIGIAATMTSTNEVEITTSDTVYREVLYGTEAGASIAMETLLANQAIGSWPNDTYLDAAQRVLIKHGSFMSEGQDSDASRTWNYWERYKFCDSPVTKPIDDLNVSGTNSSTPYTTDTDPDIRVNIPGQFVVDIDVDKVKAKHIAGSGAEFGSGAEGMFGTKITYNFNCIGTLPGRSRLDSSAPKAEVMVGYRYVPAGM